MNAQVLLEIVKTGKKPMVRLMGSLWEESFGQRGMIARLTQFSEKEGGIFFVFDYEENRDHNLSLDSSDWYLGGAERVRLGRNTGNAIEANLFKDGTMHEGVWFESTDEIAVELVGEDTPLASYLASGDKCPYVEWLEEKLMESKSHSG